MATKKYDEIVKQSLDSLAQTISDMTYCFNETRVPKNHYKGMMNEIIEQEISHQVTMGILNTYVSTLKQMKDDSPKLFIQALICMEENIKSKTGLRPYEKQALDAAYEHYLSNERKGFVKDDIIDVYEDINKNGILHLQENEQEDEIELD